jgi:hypothetical protein
MNATLNNREMTVTNVEAIEGALAADLAARGWEPAFYTLTGRRGGCVVCLRSAKTGEFSKV